MRTPFAVVLLIFAAGLPHHPSGLSPQAPAERPPVVGYCCLNACACPGASTAGSDTGAPGQAGPPPASLCAASSGG